MITVLCHNCCPPVPKGMITVETDCGLSDKQMEEIIDYHMKYCGESDDKVYPLPMAS